MAEIIPQPEKHKKGNNRPGPIKEHERCVEEYGKCICELVPPTAKKAVNGAVYCSRDIIYYVKYRTGYKEKVVADIYNEIFHFIGRQISNGRSVVLPGFGSWHSIVRPQREYMGGYCREKMIIPKRKLLRFYISKYLLPLWNSTKFKTDIVDRTIEWPTLFVNMRNQRKAGKEVYKKIIQRKKQ